MPPIPSNLGLPHTRPKNNINNIVSLANNFLILQQTQSQPAHSNNNHSTKTSLLDVVANNDVKANNYSAVIGDTVCSNNRACDVLVNRTLPCYNPLGVGNTTFSQLTNGSVAGGEAAETSVDISALQSRVNIKGNETLTSKGNIKSNDIDFLNNLDKTKRCIHKIIRNEEMDQPANLPQSNNDEFLCGGMTKKVTAAVPPNFNADNMIYTVDIDELLNNSTSSSLELFDVYNVAADAQSVINELQLQGPNDLLITESDSLIGRTFLQQSGACRLQSVIYLLQFLSY